MNKLLQTTAIVGVLSVSPAFADTTAMIGLSWTFGGSQAGQLGISGRVLSGNQRDEWVGAFGGTYFPGTQTFGVDIGIGYNWENKSFTLTRDLLNDNWQVGLGWADLIDAENNYAQ